MTRKQLGDRYGNVLNWITHLVFWATQIITIICYRYIPEEIPKHYNGAGEIDAWGDKTIIIMLLVLLWFFYFMHLICAYIIPRSGDAKRMYGKKLGTIATEEDIRYGLICADRMVMLIDAMLILMFTWIIYCAAKTVPLGGLFVIVVLGGMFGSIAYYLIKLYRRNEVIRTR